MKKALLIDYRTGKDERTGGFWLVCRYHIPGKLATASYSHLSFSIPISPFSAHFWEGWGLTYTHAGFGCSFLVFRVWGGLVGCGVGKGWFCMLKALIVQSIVRNKKKMNMRYDVGN